MNIPRRSLSATSTATKTTATCCNCFGPLKKQFDDQMSEVYCRTCEDDVNDGEYVHIPKDRLNSPAILTNITQRRDVRLKSNTNRKKRDSSLNSQTNCMTSTPNRCVVNQSSIELGDDIVTNTDSLNESTESPQTFLTNIDSNDVIRVRGKEELPVYSDKSMDNVESPCHSKSNVINQMPIETSKDIKYTMLPSTNRTNGMCIRIENTNQTNVKHVSKIVICTNDHPLATNIKSDSKTTTKVENKNKNKCDNKSGAMNSSVIIAPKKSATQIYSTLPKMKKITAQAINRQPLSIPMRVTSDGTKIYYLCDLPKGAHYFLFKFHFIVPFVLT